MSLTKNLKHKAKEAGFVMVGVSNPETLRDLPYGPVGDFYVLRRPEEEMPNVRSVVLAAIPVWDRSFYLVVDSQARKGSSNSTPSVHSESYFFDYEIMKNKAWTVVDYLKGKGFESSLSFKIPLKTAAVKCGLGCQGKNSLLVTPNFGPRVALISILTEAELEVDEPFKEDLCSGCEKCILACPTNAIESHKVKFNRCMVYSVENPGASDVPEEVRDRERKLIQRPTPCSFIECTVCIDACPIGRPPSH